MSKIYQRTFLHYFDLHFYNQYKHIAGVESEIVLATKLAALCSQVLSIPLASYFENRLCNRIIKNLSINLSDSLDLCIEYIAKSNSVESFAQAKIEQYRNTSQQFSIYNDVISQGIDFDLNITQKQRSTTGVVKRELSSSIKNGLFFDEFESIKKLLPSTFYTNAEHLCSLLCGVAYTPEYIGSILLSPDTPKIATERLTYFVNRAYFKSYLDELTACALVVDMQKIRSLDVEKNMLHIPYREIVRELKKRELFERVNNTAIENITQLSNDEDIMITLSVAIENYYSRCKGRGHDENRIYT